MDTSLNKSYTSADIEAPTGVNIELTEICNVKCKHCYNPWRDESMGMYQLNVLKIKKIIAKLSEIGVFHVILSGGEPLSNYDILKKAMMLLKEHKMTFSMNTNLILANDKNMSELRELGLEHCLTSIPSIDPDENDEIMQSKGTLKKILNGIKACRRNDIRVSANMVVTKSNKHRVYETGKMMAELGCTKFFVTRAVPPIYSAVAKDSDNDVHEELILSHEDVKKSLDDAIKIKEEYGIAIGSLISYPLCFLGDLQKYSDFAGRGCPSQRGGIVNINSSGDLHTCVHEEETYGNIFKHSLKEIYQTTMKKWRDGSMHYQGCKGCEYLQVCHSGCQMTANAVNGRTGSKDPLFRGYDAITNHFDLISDNKIFDYINSKGKFFVPERVRFRDDQKVMLVNARWGNYITVSKDVGAFLKQAYNEKSEFDIHSFGLDRKEFLANLFFKDVIESVDSLDIPKVITGLSYDSMYLPQNSKNNI